MKMHKKSLPVRWNALALEAVRRVGTPPPVTARALALVHTSMYDAWACYNKKAVATTLGTRLRQPEVERTSENKEKAISYAAFRSLNAMFLPNLKPEHQGMFEEMMEALGYDPTDQTEALDSPVGIGNLAARLVLADRAGDGSNSSNAYADFTGFLPELHHDSPLPDEKSDRWLPLWLEKDGVGTEQAFLLPHWGLVRPFALSGGSCFRPISPPAAWNSVALQEESDQVLRLSATLTDRQKAITEYWMDGPKTETPPGHWCLLAQWVSQRDKHGLGKDVRMFFALTNALMDAGIAAWDCKHYYYYVRPVTQLRRRFAGKKIMTWGGPGKGSVSMDGKGWMPYQRPDFITPPFPEFVSGHSTFSAASAELLRLFTGNDRFGYGTTITRLDIDKKDLAEPIELRWNSFSEAAEEAGMSRLYGGIHFMQGNEKGLDMGKLVGKTVWNKCQSLWEGW